MTEAKEKQHYKYALPEKPDATYHNVAFYRDMDKGQEGFSRWRAIDTYTGELFGWAVRTRNEVLVYPVGGNSARADRKVKAVAPILKARGLESAAKMLRRDE